MTAVCFLCSSSMSLVWEESFKTLGDYVDQDPGTSRFRGCVPKINAMLPSVQYVEHVCLEQWELQVIF